MFNITKNNKTKNDNLVKALRKAFAKDISNVFINCPYYAEYFHEADGKNKFAFSYEVYSKDGEFKFASNYIYEFDIDEFVEPIYNTIVEDLEKGDVKTFR
jgi:hypothetical protein